MEQQSAYHMDLLEEKREEIQNIIRKRQRKAALMSIVRMDEPRGKQTMTAFISNNNMRNNPSEMLPDIN